MTAAVLLKPDEESAEPPRRRLRQILIGVVALAVVAGSVWWFMLRPPASDEPKPGEIITLDSTQINLSGGHYLKIGIALQLVEGAEEVDGSIALDATIDLFSGLGVTDVSRTERRQALKRNLVDELVDRYDGDVMGVYFTEFVTQ